MDKNKIKNKLKDDPAFTLEVQNPEVEALMTQYSSDKRQRRSISSLKNALRADSWYLQMSERTTSRFRYLLKTVRERLSCRFIPQRHSFLRIIRHHAL